MNSNHTPPTLIDPLEDYLGYQLRRAAFVTMSALNDAYAELGLTSAEAMVLRFAQVNPGCTQSEIGRSLGVKRTNMVPIVGGLITRGLLIRTPADGRSHSLRLTAKGVERHRQVADISLQHERHFFGDMPPRQRQQLMRTLKWLRRKGEIHADEAAEPAGRLRSVRQR